MYEMAILLHHSFPLNVGQFGIVYKALLHNWKGYIRDVVAAKTLKGKM